MLDAFTRHLLDQASILASRGEIGEAAARCCSALDLSPDEPEALLRLGGLLGQLGQPLEAIELLERAIDARPTPEGCNNLGVALQATGRSEEAIERYQEAIRFSPGYAVAWNNMGVALAAVGRHAEAARCCAQAATLNPTDAGPMNNLGNALHRLGRRAEAIEAFERALSLAPDHLDAAVNAGHACLAAERSEEAVGFYSRAVALRPGDAKLHLFLGKAFSKDSRTADSIASCRQACLLQPDLADAHATLAVGLLEAGRIADAADSFERAISIDPKQPRYYRGLLVCGSLPPQSPHLQAMERLATEPSGLDDADTVQLRYALGKALADLGRHEEAFAHLLAAAALHRKSLTYDEAAELDCLQRPARIFSRTVIEALRREPRSGCAPIFIVGMPRSGSTLVEQVLASHPAVAGLGESHAVAQSLGSMAVVESQDELTSDKIERFGLDYCQRASAALHRRGLSYPDHWTDKKLDNFRHLGLISSALPAARIIHVRRDPVDTCLSCFSLLFSGLDYTYDLAELGRRYAAYARLMSHWRAVLPPDVMIEVDYEDMVSSLEPTARRLLSHVGLQWHPACAAFHTSARAVHTASVAQVRQPIYATSIGRWRPDADTLRPLLEALQSEKKCSRFST